MSAGTWVCSCGHRARTVNGKCYCCTAGISPSTCPGRAAVSSAQAAAPPTEARPPIGVEATVSSTRRDKDSTGHVLAVDDSGIRVHAETTGRMRFYPWGQVAFVEWEAERVAAPAKSSG